MVRISQAKGVETDSSYQAMSANPIREVGRKEENLASTNQKSPKCSPAAARHPSSICSRWPLRPAAASLTWQFCLFIFFCCCQSNAPLLPPALLSESFCSYTLSLWVIWHALFQCLHPCVSHFQNPEERGFNWVNMVPHGATLLGRAAVTGHYTENLKVAALGQAQTHGPIICGKVM